MAKEVGSIGGKTRLVGLCKPTRLGTDTQWDRARRDAYQRTRLYQAQPGQEEEEFGYVYILKDAQGITKVGMTSSVSHRLCELQYIVARSRRPIQLVRAVQLPLRLARRAEAVAHSALSRYMIAENGFEEWFTASPQVCSRAVGNAVAIVSGYPERRASDVREKLPKGFSLARAYKLWGKRT